MTTRKATTLHLTCRDCNGLVEIRVPPPVSATLTIRPDTRATSVLSVRGSTVPWLRMGNLTVRFSTRAAETTGTILLTVCCGGGGLVAISHRAAPTPAVSVINGMTTFSPTVM